MTRRGIAPLARAHFAFLGCSLSRLGGQTLPFAPRKAQITLFLRSFFRDTSFLFGQIPLWVFSLIMPCLAKKPFANLRVLWVSRATRSALLFRPFKSFRSYAKSRLTAAFRLYAGEDLNPQPFGP